MQLAALRNSQTAYTPEALSAAFRAPKNLFRQHRPTGPLFFHQADCSLSCAYELNGAIFFADDRQIVPGYPRILVSSDHTTVAEASRRDVRMIDAMKCADAVVETLLDGILVRLYSHKGQFYFATNATPYGSEPLAGMAAICLDVQQVVDDICR